MKVQALKVTTICTGQVVTSGKKMDLPIKEAQRLIDKGDCISLEKKTKPKTQKTN
tara:strand:- start:158 stop:322 length:165 start_codon:yes stop_codon:yes gene_type:complete